MKKMIKILLAIWLVVFIVGCTTNENGKEVDIEDGDGDGDDIDIEETFKDTVYISTEEHIRGLADLVNSGSDYFDEKIIVMTNDITLSQNHTPIGKAAGKFTSTFDGNGYSISNLSVERTQYAGLFGYVGEGGRIRNLTVNVVEITAGGTTANYAGGLAGYYASTKAIVNCGVNIKNEILAYCSYESYAGGLIGKTVTDITINNSYSTGGLVIAHNSGSTTSGSDNYAGGLIGQAYNNIEITYCYAMTKVSANTTVSSIPGGLVGTGFSASGGLVGLAQKDIDITNSYTTGDIVGNTNIGGLIGEVKGKTTINYSYTTGYVHGSNYNGSGSGGLVGHSGAIIIGNSYSEGDVSASNSSNAGGLVGIAKTLEITVTDCHSTGDVRGSWSGGLIGYVSGWPTTVTTIKDSYTTGNVSANGEDSGNAGGLIGSGTGSIFIDNSHATGNVSAFSYAGGFMGYGSTTAIEINNCYTIGNVSATASYSRSGGLVGYGGGVIEINNSYTMGNASALDASGGFIGSASGSTYKIVNSYANGTISGQNAGGIVGLTTILGECGSVYYNSEGASKDGSNIFTTGIYPKTPEELRRQETFESWNFNNIWEINPEINDGMPYLKI